MTEHARQRVEQALLQMARLAAPTLPPAENAIVAELQRKYDVWFEAHEAEQADEQADWRKAAAA